VRAELKSIDSADAPAGLESFTPNDPSCFGLAVAAHVGPAGEAGDELFYFTVCTAAWLQRNPPLKDFEFLKGYLLVSRWHYELVERAITDLCRHTEGVDWTEVAEKLARYGNWEFEDYTGTS
jgi:hypothetical protein